MEVYERQGTWRERTVADTWRRIRPRMESYGVSRVSDITGFDHLRIPVAVSVRPSAATLSTAQGKGATRLHAFVSAAMEAIEFAVAESHPNTGVIWSNQRSLNLGYPLQALDLNPALAEPSEITQYWIEGRELLGGARALVPLSSVYLHNGMKGHLRPAVTRISTNGLASGNTRAEAELHGLFEVAERHVLATTTERIPVAVETLPLELARLLDKRTGLSIQVEAVPNSLDISVFECRIWSDDFASAALGSGAHAQPEVAVSRAITEAAQSRLTAILGTREDLNPDYDYLRSEPPRLSPTNGKAWGEFTTGSAHCPSIVAARTNITNSLKGELGYSPISVELTSNEDFSVVRIIAPGAVFRPVAKSRGTR